MVCALPGSGGRPSAEETCVDDHTWVTIHRSGSRAPVPVGRPGSSIWAVLSRRWSRPGGAAAATGDHEDGFLRGCRDRCAAGGHRRLPRYGLLRPRVSWTFRRQPWR